MDTLCDNLKRLRKQANLTQAQVAEAAGLPRATVANLEQPGANPAMSTVLAIAKALGVGVDELVEPVPEHRIFTVHPQQMQEYRGEGGLYHARLLSPISSKGVQMHGITMQVGCRSVGRPHPMGAQEFYHATVGTSRLDIDGEVVDVPAGSLVQFPGHRRHIYINPGQQICEALSVVVFRM